MSPRRHPEPPLRRRFLPLFAVLLSSASAACSGSAVIEPGTEKSKLAKAFIKECGVAAPENGDVRYACLDPEDGCPDAVDPQTFEELSYRIADVDECGTGTILVDVPCGPDPNTYQCCYVVRTQEVTGGCE